MTFNLRYASDDPPHPWSARRLAVAAMLRRASPHLLGTQEGLPGQLRDVLADLPDHYACTARGRDADGGGEAMAVLYDTERLASREHGHYWLSDTPDVPGSRSWGGEWPRMVTWVRFADLSTGRKVYVANTHLEAFDAEARTRSADLLVQRTPIEPDVPVVLTGDFNEPANGPVHERLVCDGPFADTWETAGERGPAYGTFTDFGPPVPGGDRIDWILTTPDVTTLRAAVCTYPDQPASDHLPVTAVLRQR